MFLSLTGIHKQMLLWGELTLLLSLPYSCFHISASGLYWHTPHSPGWAVLLLLKGELVFSTTYPFLPVPIFPLCLYHFYPPSSFWFLSIFSNHMCVLKATMIGEWVLSLFCRWFSLCLSPWMASHYLLMDLRNLKISSTLRLLFSCYFSYFNTSL